MEFADSALLTLYWIYLSRIQETTPGKNIREYMSNVGRFFYANRRYRKVYCRADGYKNK